MKPWHLLPHSWVAPLGSWWRDLPAWRRQAAAVAQLRSVASNISEKSLAEIETLKDWEGERTEVRRHLSWMLGLDPLPCRTALNPRITGIVHCGGFRVEKVLFESLPGLLVTANFYRPTDVPGPMPCLLYLCGHFQHPAGAKAVCHDRVSWYAQNGFACLVVDPLEQGEVPGIHHGAYGLNCWYWLSLGYTPAGVEVWNAMRALDWLEARPEIDSRRIGVSGISGGGVMSWFVSALDERVAAATPTCATYTIGTQVARYPIRWQCDCVFYPNSFELDFTAVAALVAPRPVLMLNGAKDPIFPPASYRQVFARLRRIYTLYGMPDRIASIDSGKGHDDTRLTLRESRAWMQRWLTGRTNRSASGDRAAMVPCGQLACLDSLPARAANYSIDRHFIRSVQLSEPDSSEAWLARRQQILRYIGDRVFRWLPNPRGGACRAERRHCEDTYLTSYAKAEEWCLETERGVTVRTLLVRPRAQSLHTPLLVAIRRPVGTRKVDSYCDLLPVLGRRTVMLVYPRFSELPMVPAAWTTLQRSAALVGRTVAAMQVWDVICAVRHAVDELGLGIYGVTLTGRGDGAVTALYAALQEDRIRTVILEKPPASHWHGTPLLGILRATDLPEAAGVLAPRRLTLIGVHDAVFDLTRRIYEVASAASRFTIVASLAEAILQPDEERSGQGKMMS